LTKRGFKNTNAPARKKLCGLIIFKKTELSAHMEIRLKGIVVIAGNYGSGKTEVAVNLAVHHKRAGRDVRIADLDLVNPYFRTREVQKPLSRLGIDVILPPGKYMHADLPILSPEVAGAIGQNAGLTLLDVGGDDVGATVLSALADAMRGKDIQMIQVVNPYRPFTETIEGCTRIREEIEVASRLKVTGYIGNANLIDETTAADIHKGYTFMEELSAFSRLPVFCITAPERLVPDLDQRRFNCPILPIRRLLVPPWKHRPGLKQCAGPLFNC
jgi:hypothetical protein